MCVVVVFPFPPGPGCRGLLPVSVGTDSGLSLEGAGVGEAGPAAPSPRLPGRRQVCVRSVRCGCGVAPRCGIFLHRSAVNDRDAIL